MKDELKYIDELFEKELGTQEMGTASQGWATVSTGLAKKGFLAYLKSTLWLKVVAGISTVGLISVISIIILTPINLTDVLNIQDQDVKYQPRENNYNKQNIELANNISDEKPVEKLNESINISNNQSTTTDIINNENEEINPLKLNKSNNNNNNLTNINQKENESIVNIQSDNSIQYTESPSTPNIGQEEQALSSIPQQISYDKSINEYNSNPIVNEETIDLASVSNQKSQVGDLELENQQIDKELDLEVTIPNELSNSNSVPELTGKSTDSEEIEASYNSSDEVNNPEISSPLQNETDKIKIENILADKEINSIPASQENDISDINISDIDLNSEENYIPEISGTKNEDYQHNYSSARMEYDEMLRITALPPPLKGFEPLTQKPPQSLFHNQSSQTSPSKQNGYNPLSWALSGWYSPQVLAVNLSTDNTETEPILPYLTDGLQSPSILNGGIRLEARSRNFVFETGLGFMDISQPADYFTTDISFLDNTLWSYWDTTIIDLAYDSLFHIIGPDTIWNYYSNSDTTFLSDSTSYIVTDTITNEKSNIFKNTYRYIEIPLIVGYSFNKGRLTMTLKGGVITSFLWKSSGQSLTAQTSESIYSFSRDNFPSTRLDLYSGLEARYLIGARYFVFGEAFYRQSVNPIVLSNNISYHINSYGLKLGAGMYF